MQFSSPILGIKSFPSQFRNRVLRHMEVQRLCFFLSFFYLPQDCTTGLICLIKQLTFRRYQTTAEFKFDEANDTEKWMVIILLPVIVLLMLGVSRASNREFLAKSVIWSSTTKNCCLLVLNVLRILKAEPRNLSEDIILEISIT